MVKTYSKWGLCKGKGDGNTVPYELRIDRNILVDNSDLNNFNFEPDDDYIEVLGYGRWIHDKLEEVIKKKEDQIFKYIL